ncbi:leucine-rich repeat domain-containing protein [Chitinophaga oryzae]|uniref:Leucine-rich repeat domain-containing protein n=1 Tax=Chitinophaga oryzae TaxID=2725414 RepID=A0AAE6ZNQ1_9BACT|nr:leucine-rich repeat domain-containing protein [Chitinophaga oryzae]QJB35528.1 leucine-rich repeat domain-containing protein [Chitinophaga oryzae]QJB42071.1 leucine-rich repeat domain-containing protein [Chitinophaga oryzae]
MLYKFLLGCVLLLLGLSCAEAQVIHFPDPNFKEALLRKKIDTNNDGEIQVTEAQKVTKLYLEETAFSSMEGLKSFSHLEEFGTYKNRIRQVDLQGMLSLKRLYLVGSDIESLNIKGCSNLEHLSLTGNRLTGIDISEFRKLTMLSLNYNQLTKIEINNYPELKELNLSDNNITDFKISGCPKLESLLLRKNRIAGSLNLTEFPQLVAFSADNNPLSAVNIRGLRKLESFSCLYCNITTLNLSGAESLADLIW